MAWFILLGTLTACGALSILWAALGWLLPESGTCALVFLCKPGQHADGAILRYRWLRSLGLLSGPLLIAGSSPDAAEQAILEKKYPGVEFCDLEELASRLELEREQLG